MHVWGPKHSNGALRVSTRQFHSLSNPLSPLYHHAYVTKDLFRTPKRALLNVGMCRAEDWGNLVFSLRMEDPDAQTRAPAVYDTVVPCYVQSGRGELPLP